MRFIVTDETGRKYGRWTVVKRVQKDKKGKAHWLCRCNCGKEKIVTGVALRMGTSTSCGCYAREKTAKTRTIDLTGMQFGRFTVLSLSGRKNGSLLWLCQCQCGNKKIINGRDLRGGKTRSCGCLKRDVISLPVGMAAERKTLSHIRSSAKRRNIEWGLSDQETYHIMTQPCYYCGTEPKQSCTNGNRKSNRRRFNGNFLYNGIDRIDNSKGYIVGNVVPCCGSCNKAKGTMNIDEFYQWIKKLTEKYIADNQITRAWEML